MKEVVFSVKRTIPLALAIILMLMLAGCSLPGWHFDHEQESRWFTEEDRPPYRDRDPRWFSEEAERPPEYAEMDFRPTIRKITPTLIRDLRSESWFEGLGIDQVPDGEFESYTVGPGDVLQIRVFGHSDMNLAGPSLPGGIDQSFYGDATAVTGRIVGPDGTLFYPFVGQFQAAGKTVNEIRNIINEGLSTVIRSPQVDVAVLTYVSKKAYVVSVTGDPCVVPITEFGVTVVDALVLCGAGGQQAALREKAASQVIRLVREGRRYTLDLSQMYAESGINIYLRDNDRLVVDRSFNRVFVVGEFGAQSVASIPPTGLTLAEAMTAEGGLNVQTADPGNIFVIRGLIKKESLEAGLLLTQSEPEVFHLNARSVDALVLADQFQLRPRDIIFASPADTVSASRAVAQVLPLVNSLFQTIFIGDRLRDRRR